MIARAVDLDREELEYEVCVIGGGPAGLTLGLELSTRGRRVCVLEAGGESYTASAQALLEGAVEGEPYPPLRSTRMAVLGGSTQVWAGWCRPLDPIDFQERPALGSPGWPIGRDELIPYYRRAHELCGLSPFEYDPEFWRAKLGRQPLTGDANELVHSWFHVRARNFAELHRRRLEREPALDVLLHASATRLELGENGSVGAVAVRLQGDRRMRVRARQFVLAAGGIENPRLLLLSASTPERAPGNAHDLVGRYFTDHPFVNPGALVLREPRPLDFYFPCPVEGVDGAGVRTTLTLPPGLVQRDNLPSAALFFHPRYEAHPAFTSPQVRAMLELREKLRSRAVPGAAWPLVLRALRRPDRLAMALLRRLLVHEGPARRWRVRMMFETSSRYENRVRLGSERDALGRPRAHLEWRLSDADVSGMRRSVARFDGAFRRAGIGHIESMIADSNEAWLAAVEGGKHHMGTTRMHPDPARGVVDTDCRVHGTSNLYAAGSSVFPSGGYANPTLTIVALAVRLGEHIDR
jgi:choline dehydrogenase-like flavoprotein